MSKTALLVIDMLNEYLMPDGLVFCSECRAIIPTIRKTIDFCRSKGVPIIYVNTCLNDKKDVMVKKWGLHAMEGSIGSQVVKELQPQKSDIII